MTGTHPSSNGLHEVHDLLERARGIARAIQDPSLTPAQWRTLNEELATIDSRLEVVRAQRLQAPPAQPPVAAPLVVERAVQLDAERSWEGPRDLAQDLPPELANEPPAMPSARPTPEETVMGLRAARASSAATTPQKKGQRGKRGGLLRFVLIAFLLLLVGFAVGFVWMVGSAAMRAQQTAMTTGQRLADLRAGGDASAGADPLAALTSTCQDATDLDRDLKPIIDLVDAAGPASDLIGQVPGVGAKANAMVTLAQATRETSSAVRTACEVLTPLAAAGASGDAQSVLATYLHALHARGGDLRSASARLRAAHAQVQQIDETVLDETPRRALVAMREKLPSAAARIALVGELPTLMGIDGGRSYLVLGQNSDELRPSGGFIGTSGVLEFQSGRLTRSEYGSSFSHTLPPSLRVPPPAPLVAHMGARYWQLWEGNWWPDFPSSAKQVEYFYRHAVGEPIHGVIAVNQEIIRSLLEVTGPVAVPEFGETVDASNVQRRMEYHVHEQRYPDPVRKKFVSLLFRSVMEQVQTLPRDRLGTLVSALNDAFYDQHLQMWSSDPSVQETINSLGWSGALHQTRGDYLTLVSANLSANKVNRDVRHAVSYRVVDAEQGTLRGELELRMRNERSPNDPGPYATADYYDYLRIYVPAGSRLIAQDGFDMPLQQTSECGYTSFGSLVTVKAGEQRTLKLSYWLPPSIQASNYSLVVQRQSGVRPYDVQVDASGLIPGLDSRGVELNGSYELRLRDGQLSAARLTGTDPSAGARPACELHLAPPETLASPAELGIPRLGVRAPVTELGIDNAGELESPDNGRDVAWYPQGARPGQGGNMVMAGHLDWNRGPAVFFKLAELKQGDRITVTDEQGNPHTYSVDWVRKYEASSAPLNQILGPTTESWITLITCGGPFNQASREYRDRIVVRGSLLS